MYFHSILLVLQRDFRVRLTLSNLSVWNSPCSLILESVSKSPCRRFSKIWLPQSNRHTLFPLSSKVTFFTVSFCKISYEKSKNFTSISGIDDSKFWLLPILVNWTKFLFDQLLEFSDSVTVILILILLMTLNFKYGHVAWIISQYRLGTVNSKSFVGKVLLRIICKFELINAL